MTAIHKIAALVVVALVSCGRAVVDCDYNIHLTVQEVQGGERIGYGYGDAIVYAFAGVDIAQWYAASYEDALAGRLTSVEDGSQTIVSSVTAMRTDSVFHFRLTEMPVAFLICDTEVPIYGWRDSNVRENLVRMDIIAVFQHWFGDTITNEGTPEEGYSNIENGHYRRRVNQNGWTMVYVGGRLSEAEPEL
jgi:hypothetical protein